MERETNELKIGGKTFEVKTYATAREVATIQAGYFKGSKMELVGQEPKISEFNPNVGFEVKLELVNQMVVSIDGVKENIVGTCENLPSNVFDELTDALDAIVSKKKS